MSLPKEVYNMVSMEELDQWWMSKAINSVEPTKHTHTCRKCKQKWQHNAICSSHIQITCKSCAGTGSYFTKGYVE